LALKVLLADDSMTAQNMGKKILADAGFDVATVSNGAAAIKKVAEFKPNIVILDIYMPGYTGLEVCERIRATDTTMPVLLTVGKLEPFRQEDVDHVHADAVIVKPFEATDLINTVQKFVDQADLAASKAPVPPPPPVVAVPPPPPPAQLSEEDLAFLRGEVTEQVAPAPMPAASNAGHAAAANPDFADLLAAPQMPVTAAEPEIALNDLDLPPLTESDFDMLQGAAATAPSAYVDAPVFATPAVDLLAPEAPALASQPAIAPPAPVPAEVPVFQLDEHLPAEAVVESHYGSESILEPAQPEPLFESAPHVAEAEPVAQPAMAAATAVFELAPEVHTESAPAFAAEPVLATEPAPIFAAEPALIAEPAFAAAPVFAPEPTAVVLPSLSSEPAFAAVSAYSPEPVFVPESTPAFDLELPAEPVPPTPAEPIMEPVLETAPVAAVAEVAPAPELEPELEPLELEQSGPQPTADAVATEVELAPAYEFIGVHGTTPADADIEAITAEPLESFAQPAEVPQHEAVLEVAAAAVPVAAGSAISHYAPAPELAPEIPAAAATLETAEPAIAKDLNYATIAGVVHRVFDRYKSQMIADIVRELSQRQK
jgi:CheY-like chemotaxis protein